GLAPVWLGGAVDPDSKAVADFITLAGMRRFLNGDLPLPADLVPPTDLFDHDPRVGVGIDVEALVSEEGILYTTSFLALAPGVALYAEIDAPEEVASKLEHAPVRFGGEGRRVVVRQIDAIAGGVPAWSVAPAGDRQLVVSISPGSYDRALPAMFRDRIRAASVGRPWAHSGWDATLGGPRPTRQQAPAGSVWFVQGDVPRGRSLSATEEEAARGEGLFLTGVWQ
ncbi:MAG: type III-B CRISPR module-associated Cmr3 family protein, partial [Candidatus Binatia bacterium]